MSTIIAIAQKDIRIGFRTMKVWSLFFVFLMILGVFWFTYLDSYVAAYHSAARSGSIAPQFAEVVRAIFGVVQFVLVLIVPAVTMGSFAEEKRANTMLLLRVAPVPMYAVVLGKLLGAFIIMVVVMGLSIPFPLQIFAFGSFDPGVLVASYFGLILLALFQVSFGIWMSALCTRPVVAYLATVAGLFFLLIVSSLSGLVRGDGAITAFARYLGFSEHFQPFLTGTISLGNVAYFIIFAAMFLFASLVSLEAQMGRW